MYKDTLQYYYIGESVYIELEGDLYKSKQNFFSEEPIEYNLIAKKILTLQKQYNTPEDCCYCDFKGEGKIPIEWTLEISEIDEYIIFRDNDAKRSYLFDYNEPDEEENILWFKSTNNGNNTSIEIKIHYLINIGETSSEKKFKTEIYLNNKYFKGYIKQCL